MIFFFQLKKLVYVYLVRYAEEQQDLALLSISTFQRALKVKPAALWGPSLWVTSLSFWGHTLRLIFFFLPSILPFLKPVTCGQTIFFPLQDPNQLIRASALRVLSSIRVPIIVPIMMLAIKEAAADLSPYVRKTSAHAIQKLYRYCCASFVHRMPAGQFAWGYK